MNNQELGFEVDVEDTAEPKDFIDVLTDDRTDILAKDFISEKKKLSSAINGRSEVFDLVRQKSKALEMINNILISNKEIMKSEDLYFVDELKIVFAQAKNDKQLFESVSKRVKGLLAMITKNQILINKKETFNNLSNVLFEILK